VVPVLYSYLARDRRRVVPVAGGVVPPLMPADKD
jgi:hypothetical protein